MPFNKSVVASGDQDEDLGRMTLEFLRKAKYWLVVGALLGGAAGYGATFLVRAQWNATLLLQVAQVGGDNGGAPTIVEPIGRTVDRMVSRQFKEAVLSRLGLPSDANVSPEADLVLKSANIAQMRNSDLLMVSVNGYSSEQAGQFAKAFESEVSQVHDKLAKPTIDKLKTEQSSTEDSLVTEERRRTELQKLAQEQFRGDVAGKFSQSVLLSQMLSQNELSLLQLERRERALKEQLDPTRTFGTHSLLGAADISRRPVFPRRSAFVGAGILAGLALAVVLLLVRQQKRK